MDFIELIQSHANNIWLSSIRSSHFYLFEDTQFVLFLILNILMFFFMSKRRDAISMEAVSVPQSTFWYKVGTSFCTWMWLSLARHTGMIFWLQTFKSRAGFNGSLAFPAIFLRLITFYAFGHNISSLLSLHLFFLCLSHISTHDIYGYMDMWCVCAYVCACCHTRI